MPDDYQSSLRDTLIRLPMAQPPQPWKQHGVHAIGGLTEVGYVLGTDMLLVVSSQGRGMFDCTTGERIARDRDEEWEGLDQTKLLSPGIGPFAQTIVRLAGLHGGGLPMTTYDGWSLECVQLPWPSHYFFMSPPWKSDCFDQWIKIATDGACEFRACGFSETGRSFVIATSCEVMLYGRQGA